MSVLASDSFNRSNSTTTLGSTDSAYGGTSYTWSSATTYGISSNQAQKQTGSATLNSTAWINPTVSDCAVSVTFATIGNNPRLVFRRSDDGNTFYVLGNGSTNYEIIRRQASVSTVIATIAKVPAAGDIVKATCSGSSITVTINGTNSTTVTDTFNQTATIHGFVSDDTTARFDDFKVEDLGTGTTTQNASASGGSVSGGTANVTYTQNASANGGSISGGTSSAIATLNASASGGSTSGGSSSISSTLSATAAGGSTSGGSTANIVILNASASGGSTSGGTASGVSSATVTASATGGSISGGTASGATSTSIQASASGGSTSGGNATSPSYQQNASASGGSSSGGQSVGVAIMQYSANGGSISGGQAFAQLLQQASASGGSSSGGTAWGGPAGTQNVSASGGSVSGGSAAGITANGIIGRVQIKGSRQLHVAILGSRQLRVLVKGGVPLAQTGQTVSMYAGESKYVDDIATDVNADGTTSALNLTGATIKWAMKTNVYSSNLVYKDNTTTGGVTITDVANGKFSVQLLPSDTQNLNGNYYHEAKVTDASGNVSVVSTGTITISPSGVS